MSDWLIRTSNLQVLGPFSKRDLIEMIESGEVLPQDEVCRANHYWIFVHEHEELQEQLGIQAPVRRGKGDTDEITETDVTPFKGIKTHSRMPGQFVSPKHEASTGGENASESTVMFQVELETREEPEKKPSEEPTSKTTEPRPIIHRTSSQPIVAAPVERPALLRGLASTLIVLSLLLLWMAMQRLWSF